MTRPTPAEAQAAITELHRTYCDATGRMEALRFHERTWSDLLTAPEYEYDATRLTADVLHLVRYLQRGIREGKRNAGALKLANFLQVDRFLSDLAEARVQMKPQRTPRPMAHRPEPGEEPAPIEAAKALAADLAKFREGMR